MTAGGWGALANKLSGGAKAFRAPPLNTPLLPQNLFSPQIQAGGALMVVKIELGIQMGPE